MEIFIAGAEQGLDVACEFNIFFHSELWRRLRQLGTGLTRLRKDEMWVAGMWFTAMLGRTRAGVFARERLGMGVERTGLRTPTTGRLPNI